MKPAYRYLSLENYLHPKEHWQATKNRQLEEAGLLDFADIDQLITTLQKKLHGAYHKTNRRIKAINHYSQWVDFNLALRQFAWGI